MQRGPIASTFLCYTGGMLVSFVGSPCSGKTTTAASVFAELKASGLPAEFVGEHARLYIAQAKCKAMDYNVPFELTDEDQRKIFINQYDIERTMTRVCGPEVVVISDSCPLNSLLYMNDLNVFVQPEAYIAEVANSLELIFVCDPVKPATSIDPNRIHDEEQSKAIHAKIEPMLAKWAPHIKTVPLFGPNSARVGTVLRHLYSRTVW